MKNLLYIGNKLKGGNKTVTTIDTLSKNLKREGFRVKTASSKKNKFLRLLDMLRCIYKNRNNADFVLIDTYSTLNFYYTYMCSKLCRILNLKYIPILHGGDLPKRLKKSPRFSIEIFKNAYINITPSKYLMSAFEKEGFNNLVYIPNSIEIKNYNYSKRVVKKLKLLWVRSFSKIYNPFLAVEIADALKNKGYDVELCMVGPDKDGSLLETKSLVKELKVDVKFTGKLPKEAWIDLSKDYNVFINTTNVDNTPVSVIEAMALGLPVISTNVGGMPFLIDNEVDGLLVKPNNVDSFVLAIKKLKNSEIDTEQMVKKAREKVESFDWEVVKQDWLKLLS